MKITEANVYRFHDAVAINLPGAYETVYLSAKLAKQLAKALVAGAKDVTAQPKFHLSTFEDTTVTE